MIRTKSGHHLLNEPQAALTVSLAAGTAADGWDGGGPNGHLVVK